jgi:hypothetical protein
VSPVEPTGPYSYVVSERICSGTVKKRVEVHVGTDIGGETVAIARLFHRSVPARRGRPILLASN